MKKLIPYALLILLAGCAGTPEKNLPPCPETGFMRDAQETLVIAKTVEIPGEEDVRAYAALQKLGGSCAYKQKKNLVELDVSFDLFVRQSNPDANIESEKFSYFVAVLDLDERILQKELFETSVFYDEQGIGLITEEHRINIPYMDINNVWKYKTVIGFQQTPEIIALKRALYQKQ